VLQPKGIGEKVSSLWLNVFEFGISFSAMRIALNGIV
jgi:hypothetical protein